MQNTSNNFLKLLFQDGETTCFANSPNGTSVSHSPKPEDVFVCINALFPHKDYAPTQPWHSENKPRRADVNVCSLRNFLVELDSGTLEEQYRLVTSRLPISACTFSGSKSLHFIISLEQPLATLQEYRHLATRLLKLVPEADPSCRNASRLTRLPCVIRPETGLEQKLWYVGSRIPLAELEARLPAVDMYTPRVRTEAEVRSYVSPLIVQASMNPEAIMQERGIKGRNSFFYWLYCRFQDVNMEQDRRIWHTETSYNNLRDKDGFSLQEAYAAARVKGH